MIDRQALAKMNHHKIEIVEVPEWGDKVGIRTLSGVELQRLFDGKPDPEDDEDKWTGIETQAAMLALTLSDEKGKPFFADGESISESISEVMKYSHVVIVRLGSLATELNGMGKKAEEGTEKNSESGPA
jgi:hypothetical protein